MTVRSHGSQGQRDLFLALHSTNEEISVETKLEWSSQIASAIAYLHSNKYAHRDVKPKKYKNDIFCV